MYLGASLKPARFVRRESWGCHQYCLRSYWIRYTGWPRFVL